MGAWSPEIPFPETGSDLSGLTGTIEERKAHSSNV